MIESVRSVSEDINRGAYSFRRHALYDVMRRTKAITIPDSEQRLQVDIPFQNNQLKIDGPTDLIIIGDSMPWDEGLINNGKHSLAEYINGMISHDSRQHIRDNLHAFNLARPGDTIGETLHYLRSKNFQERMQSSGSRKKIALLNQSGNNFRDVTTDDASFEELASIGENMWHPHFIKLFPRIQSVLSQVGHEYYIVLNLLNDMGISTLATTPPNFANAESIDFVKRKGHSAMDRRLTIKGNRIAEAVAHRGSVAQTVTITQALKRMHRKDPDYPIATLPLLHIKTFHNNGHFSSDGLQMFAKGVLEKIA